MSKEMTETTMPAAEAEIVAGDERNSYELAFHVLPTVAEGEVPSVFEAIKAHITKTGAEIFDEEAPERFELAYEIVKHYEGKNRKFTSAYFGWVRFKAEADAIETLTEVVEEDSNILRYLLIKLTKVEEANPFRIHEALASQKVVTDVAEVPEVDSTEAAADTEVDSTEAAADDAEIDEALEKNEA